MDARARADVPSVFPRHAESSPRFAFYSHGPPFRQPSAAASVLEFSLWRSALLALGVLVLEGIRAWAALKYGLAED